MFHDVVLKGGNDPIITRDLRLSRQDPNPFSHPHWNEWPKPWCCTGTIVKMSHGLLSVNRLSDGRPPLELARGVEPPTCGLRNRCSTTELLWRCANCGRGISGAPRALASAFTRLSRDFHATIAVRAAAGRSAAARIGDWSPCGSVTRPRPSGKPYGPTPTPPPFPRR